LQGETYTGGESVLDRKGGGIPDREIDILARELLDERADVAGL
jgi:hypothetical protein